VNAGAGPVSLILQVALTDAQGVVTDTFRSDVLNIVVSNGFNVNFGSGGSSTLTYTEGDVPAQLAAGLTLTAGASSPAQLTGAAVQLGGYAAGQDFLSIGGVSDTSGTVAGLDWEFDVATGILSLSGPADVAVYEAALRQVTYFNSSQNPSTVGRTITFVVGDGAAPLGQADLAVDVVAVDNVGIFQVPVAPSLTAGVPGAAVGQIVVNDPDSTYTLSIGGGFDSQFEIVNGQLQLIAGQSITTPGVIEVPLIATDDVTGATLTQSLFITVIQGAADLTIGGLTPPVGGGSSFTVDYIEQQTPPVVVASGVTVQGTGAIDSASVAITGFDAAQQEQLGIAGQTGTSGAIAGTGITWNYDAATGILSFVSADVAAGTTAADYETALRQVVYSNNSDAPLTTRSVVYTVGTGAGAGQGTATIGITPVNDAPTAITLSSTNVSLGTLGAIVGEIGVVDPDSTDGFNFSFSDPRFTVVSGPNGLQLRLLPGESLATPLNLDITVTDSGNPPGSLTQTFTIVPSASDLTPVPQDDFLFAEPGSGLLQVWTVNNISEVIATNIVQDGGNALTIPPSWSIIDTGDFDGNGIADILWQGTDGPNQVVGIWYMNPAGELQNTAVVQLGGANASLGGFDIVGGADMNGDGNLDLVLRDAAADLTQIWLLDGTPNPSILGGQAGIITLIDPRTGQPFRATDPNWSIDALGDFDGDGDIDLVYRWAEQSATTIVNMNGTEIVGLTGMPELGPTFEIRAVGDFTGDGIDDILWRDNRYNQGINTVDQTILWTLGVDPASGDFTETASDVVTAVPLFPGWQIVGSGDFNADNVHDIVFRNEVTDEEAIWLMQDGEVLATRFVTDERPDSPNPGLIAKINQPGQSWSIVGVNEFG
ncbi:VCBS repeat-containing protein, partial [filamentous cyanobacterium LEGE 11480]